MKSDNKVYNILLPIWLLIFFPSWLWLLLIPANYLIDRIVLRWSLGELPDKGLFCRKNILSGLGGKRFSFLQMAGEGVMFDPLLQMYWLS